MSTKRTMNVLAALVLLGLSVCNAMVPAVNLFLSSANLMNMYLGVGYPIQIFSAAVDLSMTESWVMNCEALMCQNETYDPYSSVSFAPQNELFRLDQPIHLAANGSFEGAWVQDRLDFGNLLLLGMDYLMLNKAPVIRPLPFIASFGLGRVARSEMPHMNFITLLQNANVIKSGQFAISRSPVNTTVGRIVFGDVTPGMYVGSLDYFPIYEPQRGFWSLFLNSTSVGNTTTPLQTCAILDTTFPYISAPVDVFQLLCNQLGFTDIRSYTTPGTYYAVADCALIATLPDLVLTFDTTDYTFPPSRYLRPGMGGVCYFMVLGVDLASPKGPAWLLGDFFMQGRMINFDLDNERIGIAISTL
ncbi:Saccharopepsin [Paramicrosporidium saccamoebae]|uniref:Saccharopepsin n=1 Tax=Paramicrosporidium saccamoebae TaxID=1246581 RepID=A0A2H9TQW7_9FUNG|nr:Saccharopepsin [Paramicrosporidium saccamoebae]